jgi:two-component system C4-dicarboxylate transport sensor histidine kinase DctB
VRTSSRAERTEGDLAAVHRRFGRAVILIYLGAAAVAIGLLVAAAATDMAHQQATARDTLLLNTETRAHYLGRELGLLAGELRRLGLRSEVDLLDQNMAPEESLLRLSHEKSTFFNVGVGIVDQGGSVLWSLPAGFLAPGRSVAGEWWFKAARRAADVQIVPVSPESDEDSLVYLVAPVVRNGKFSGALIGGIDLVVGGELDDETRSTKNVLTVLATKDGTVVYPAKPPAFAATAAWRQLFTPPSWEPFVRAAELDVPSVVAADPVSGADLELVSVVQADVLDAPARARLRTRLAFGTLIAVLPLLLLVLLLRRTLRSFSAAQEAAARDERVKLIGEAANLIAHEIKNSLNGLQVGLELVTRPKPPSGTEPSRALGALRSELTRLSSFTTRLLTFSKGVAPRPQTLDLAAFVAKVCELYAEQAAEARVELRVDVPAEPLTAPADSTLVHLILSNLVTNAVDALATAAPGQSPRVVVSLRRARHHAELRVSDNGPGVAASVRPKLFEPFVTGKPSGVGIGLALSRKIARAHGGELALEPTPVGATFLCTLPLTEVSP